jgi:hypothetical protein
LTSRIYLGPLTTNGGIFARLQRATSRASARLSRSLRATTNRQRH